jgi:hypothetical protein
MNYRRILGWMACFAFIVVNARAQSASLLETPANLHPVLFNQFPQKSPCDLESLEKLFSATGKVSETVAPGILLRGEVIARTQQSPQVQSINISMSDFSGVMFTLSRIRLENGSLLYNGHVVSLNHTDALVLTIENGKYYFIKTTQPLFVAD